MREREGSDKKKQGLCVGAVQSSVDIGADLLWRSVRAISVYSSVCTGIVRRVVRYVGVRGGAQARLCMAGYIYGVVIRVKFWVAAY